jgi:hypothetical protein
MSQNDKDLNGQWGTHLPVLARVLDITEGSPVLELGTGVWSTMLFHIMCAETKRPAFSYDNDPKWHESNLKWQNDYHNIILVEDFVDEEGNWHSGFEKAPLENTHWGVVLVDHKPASRRKEDIKRLAKHADFILIHDSEPESDKFFKYSWIYKHFKYRFDYTKCRPHTTVLSNFIDVAKLLA